MYTIKQEQIVKSTFKFITARKDGTPMKQEEIAQEFIIPFYENLFLRDSSLRKYFRHLEDTSCKFALAFSSLIGSLHKKDFAASIVDIGIAHKRYAKDMNFSISDKTFSDVGGALVETIVTRLYITGYQFSETKENIVQSWVAVYKEIVSIMKDALENDQLDWQYELYFDILYPMGLVSTYDKATSTFTIRRINRILFSNLNETEKKINPFADDDSKAEDIVLRKLNASGKNIKKVFYSYDEFFKQYFFGDLIDKTLQGTPEKEDIAGKEYQKLIQIIIEYYTREKTNRDDADDWLNSSGYLEPGAFRKFELEDDKERCPDFKLLIIKSKVPGGIRTKFYNKDGNPIYVDLYAVPQIHEKKFSGIQNVIPVVNERKAMYDEKMNESDLAKAKDAEIDRNRVIHHIVKGIYLRLSVIVVSDLPGKDECLAINFKILGFTLDWRQVRKPEKEPSIYCNFLPINFLRFLKAVYAHALIMHKYNIESLPTDLLKKIFELIKPHIDKTIAESILPEIVEQMLSVDKCWDLFEDQSWNKDRYAQGTIEAIRHMTIVVHGNSELLAKFYYDEQGSVNKYEYYIFFQTFFEIFVNHIKHNQARLDKHFYLWINKNELIFSNSDHANINQLNFGDVSAIIAGESKYGLISLKKEFESRNMSFDVVELPDKGNKKSGQPGLFAQRITWNDNVFFET